MIGSVVSVALGTVRESHARSLRWLTVAVATMAAGRLESMDDIAMRRQRSGEL